MGHGSVVVVRRAAQRPWWWSRWLGRRRRLGGGGRCGVVGAWWWAASCGRCRRGGCGRRCGGGRRWWWSSSATWSCVARWRRRRRHHGRARLAVGAGDRHGLRRCRSRRLPGRRPGSTVVAVSVTGPRVAAAAGQRDRQAADGQQRGRGGRPEQQRRPLVPGQRRGLGLVALFLVARTPPAGGRRSAPWSNV